LLPVLVQQNLLTSFPCNLMVPQALKHNLLILVTVLILSRAALHKSWSGYIMHERIYELWDIYITEDIMLWLTTLMYPESLYSHKLMFRNQTIICFHNVQRFNSEDTFSISYFFFQWVASHNNHQPTPWKNIFQDMNISMPY